MPARVTLHNLPLWNSKPCPRMLTLEALRARHPHAKSLKLGDIRLVVAERGLFGRACRFDVDGLSRIRI